MGMALAGIIEGAKNSIAAMSTVLTILRIFICRPQRPRKSTLNPNLVVRMAYDISATVDNDSVAHLTRDDLANALPPFSAALVGRGTTRLLCRP
jgi:hypothetical protein